MTDPNYAAIMLLIDRSGSMDLIREAAEEGINGFIKDQVNADGRRTIRIAQFDSDSYPHYDGYQTVCESTDPASIPPFQLSPRGSTALLDAMGRSIAEFGAELAALPEHQRPGTVILAIMTDGKENASHEHTFPEIKAMVQRHEREFGWQVVYLGANQDAIAVGASLGVRSGQTMTYAATDSGTRSATSSLSSYVAVAASGQEAVFTDQQRADATK
jgi:hypothetical protein